MVDSSKKKKKKSVSFTDDAAILQSVQEEPQLEAFQSVQWQQLEEENKKKRKFKLYNELIQKQDEDELFTIRKDERKMRTAMEIIARTHPLSEKLSIQDIFPMCMSVKKSIAWDNFYEKYHEHDKHKKEV